MVKKIIASLFCFLCLHVITNAQPPNIQWQNCLGGTYNEGSYDRSFIEQTSDGGYITCTSTASNNGDVSGFHGNPNTNLDIWIIKINSSGVFQWQRCLGGTNWDEPGSIHQTTDGGYIVAGYTVSNDGDVNGNHGQADVWVVKIDGTGNLMWQKCLGGSSDEEAYSIQQTTDGGYIITGSTISNDGDVSGNHGGQDDVWVVKLDGLGNLMWQKCLGGTGFDKAYRIQQTTDGGYILTGETTSNDFDVNGNHGNYDIWVIKLNATGNIDWKNCYGGTSTDIGSSVTQTSDGGYLVAGYSNSNDGNNTSHIIGYDFWVLKLNAFGNLQWEKSYGGEGYDYPNDLTLTDDGGFVMAGHSNSGLLGALNNHGNNDYMIVKADSVGNMVWEYEYGGSSDDRACAIKQTADGGFIVAGETSSNDGDINGNLHGAGGGYSDLWVVKLAGITNGLADVTENKLKLYPNPAKEYAMVQLTDEFIGAKYSLTDATGRVVAKGIITATETTLHLNNLPAGVYTFNAAGATKKIAKF